MGDPDRRDPPRPGGPPRDIAEMTYSLASERARHLTDRTLHVTGGAHPTR
ncbi:hypothetical protein [Amycolatopsis sp. NPDC051061]